MFRYFNDVVALVLLLVSTLILSSCTDQSKPVTVSKLPMKIETKYLEELPAEQPNPLHDHERAATDWKFGCKVDFKFEVTDQAQLANEYLTTVKVKSVSLQLDAPVVIWLPKDADDKLIAHENAHVDICKKFYSGAKKDARLAAQKVVGKNFQGTGKTYEASIKSALAIANREVCDYYHMNMTEKIDRVSEIFDSLDSTLDQPSEQLIEMAFKQYRTVKSAK